MPAEIPTYSPEKEIKPDDARKFVVGSNIDLAFLEKYQAETHNMTVDWIEIGSGTETKIARKAYDNGTVEILKITKVKVDGSRIPQKDSVSPDDYPGEIADPLYHLDKRRYEFTYNQNEVDYSLKYDVIEGGRLYLLEVDAESAVKRDNFNPMEFEYPITEVSGKPEYEGYRIVDFLKTL
ncbi:MAG: hypothetical protein JWN75_150 [Candidatus Saccharibacteria bacterium]|nr:hypothetical protein [Candidatus Saccharibacteria bacterium]